MTRRRTPLELSRRELAALAAIAVVAATIVALGIVGLTSGPPQGCAGPPGADTCLPTSGPQDGVPS